MNLEQPPTPPTDSARPLAVDRKPFLAALDEGPPSRGAAIGLVVIAALFAFSWLASSIAKSVFLAVFTGPEAARFPVGAPPLYFDRLIGNAVVALALGALAGTAVRRCKWLVGPGIIAVVVSAMCLAWFAHTRHGVPVSPGSATLIHHHLRVGAPEALYIAVVLVSAAFGGLLSGRIFRRVPLRLVAIGMLAWVGAWVLFSLFMWLASGLVRGPYGEWDLADLVWRVVPAAPFFLAAFGVAWASGRQGFWLATLVVGGAAVFQVLAGYVRIETHNDLKNLLEEAHWALRGLASAAVGAWATVAALRIEHPPKLARDAIIIVGLIALAAVIGWLADQQPSGFGVAIQMVE